MHTTRATPRHMPCWCAGTGRSASALNSRATEGGYEGLSRWGYPCVSQGNLRRVTATVSGAQGRASLLASGGTQPVGSARRTSHDSSEPSQAFWRRLHRREPAAHGSLFVALSTVSFGAHCSLLLWTKPQSDLPARPAPARPGATARGRPGTSQRLIAERYPGLRSRAQYKTTRLTVIYAARVLTGRCPLAVPLRVDVRPL
jgi:hypothetical protein